MISSCHGGLKDWHSSVKVLEELVEEFKSRAKLDGILMNIALIYRDNLRDDARCRETLACLIREYPVSPLAKTAKALMQKNSNDDKPGSDAVQ